MRFIYLAIVMLSLQTAHAAVIFQAQDVWTDGDYWANPTANVINQSGLYNDSTGLNSTYISGVTEFYDFVNGNSARYYGGGWDINTSLGDTSAPLDNFYFDLGSNQAVEAIAIWNQAGTASLIEFDIYAATDASFSDKTYLGSGTSFSGDQAGSIYNFNETESQFFMIDVVSNAGYCCATRLNEVAFAVTSVPIPAAVWLFGSGLGLLGWFRRRQTA
jgi:hypothetical protein